MEITPKTRILDVLTHYPFLEEEIIRAAPPFENLRNPVLRRTVARLATLEQAAHIGGLNAPAWVNHLRRLVGQTEWSTGLESGAPLDIPPTSPADPDWVQGDPQFVVDGNQLLARGEVPLEQINQLLQKMEDNRFILLITSFEPQPMIEAMQKQNRKLYSRHDGQYTGRYLTFIG